MPTKVTKPAATKIGRLRRYVVYLGHTRPKGFFVKVAHGVRARPHRLLKVTRAAKAALGKRTVQVGLKGKRFTAHVVRATPRQKIVRYAKLGVLHEPQIHYSEAAIRGGWLAWARPGGRFKLPLTTDCSGFATLCYRMAGLPDPNGLGYKSVGYTGTLLDHAAKAGKFVAVKDALPGDLIVYGPGTGEHVAIIVEAGADPLTISHGEESGPEYVRVSQDGRQPQRVCRFVA